MGPEAGAERWSEGHPYSTPLWRAGKTVLAGSLWSKIAFAREKEAAVIEAQLG